jgi:hypothetical protein
MFLLWPLALACGMVNTYWVNLPAVAAYLGVILVTCATTAIIALFCSVLFKKTAHAMMAAYLIIVLQFCTPLAANFFAQTFFPGSPATPIVQQAGMLSPFATTFSIPLDMETQDQELDTFGQPKVDLSKNWWMFAGFVAVSAAENALLAGAMIWLFNTRWRVAS